MQASVKESFELPKTASQLLNLQNETNSSVQEARNEAEQLAEETRQEEQNSLQMLNVAREIEEAAQAAMTAAEAVMFAAEARLAAALAEEAAAFASMNPAAIAAASAEVFSAQQAYETAREAYEAARQAYEAAKAHRELLEKRYEMARQAVNLAEAMKSKLEMFCTKCLTQIIPLVEQGISRITQAHADLQQYHAESTNVANLSVAEISRRSISTAATSETRQNFSTTAAKNSSAISSQNFSTTAAFTEWANYQPTLGKPVNPEEINGRLNPSSEVLQALLKNRYETDSKFKALVDSYREQAQTNRSDVERKIKQNMAGAFAEEIVKTALKPYGEFYRTQEHVQLSDGSYTKPDFVLHGLKVPLIVGRGAGMGVRENGSIAVEVKTGQPSYLLNQRQHLEKQAQGHLSCDASWTICTRDVQKISAQNQQELRGAIRAAGSPIVGFLPYKDDLDSECIKFVFGDG